MYGHVFYYSQYLNKKLVSLKGEEWILVGWLDRFFFF